MTEFEFTEKDVAIAALLPEDEMLTVGRRWRSLAAATAVRLSGEVFEIGCAWSHLGVDRALAARIEDYLDAQRESELIGDYLDGEVIKHNAIHEGLDGELVAVMVR